MITYTVNKNYNNELYLSVQNGEVVVKAPWYYTNTQIQDIIENSNIKNYAKLLLTNTLDKMSKKCTFFQNFDAIYIKKGYDLYQQCCTQK